VIDFSPEETNINYPTLSLANFDEEDQDYALVKKIGVGSTAATTNSFSANFPDGMTTEPSSTAPAKSQCVFHVAQQMSISMPVTAESLEIRERGSTRIFLTSGSDEIEAHALRSELHYSKQPVRRHRRHYGGRVVIPEEFGPGWFTWRQWKVNQALIEDYSAYLGR